MMTETNQKADIVLILYLFIEQVERTFEIHFFTNLKRDALSSKIDLIKKNHLLRHGIRSLKASFCFFPSLIFPIFTFFVSYGLIRQGIKILKRSYLRSNQKVNSQKVLRLICSLKETACELKKRGSASDLVEEKKACESSCYEYVVEISEIIRLIKPLLKQIYIRKHYMYALYADSLLKNCWMRENADGLVSFPHKMRCISNKALKKMTNAIIDINTILHQDQEIKAFCDTLYCSLKKWNSLSRKDKDKYVNGIDNISNFLSKEILLDDNYFKRLFVVAVARNPHYFFRVGKRFMMAYHGHNLPVVKDGFIRNPVTGETQRRYTPKGVIEDCEGSFEIISSYYNACKDYVRVKKTYGKILTLLRMKLNKSAFFEVLLNIFLLWYS